MKPGLVTNLGADAMLLLAASACAATSKLTAANASRAVMVAPACRIGDERYRPGIEKWRR